MAERWRQKPQGFTTVRKDGWWVRPGQQSARPAGGSTLDRLPDGSRLPDGPRGVGQFVREHYAPGLQRAVYRKLLATGDTFTPAGNGPPPAGTPAAAPRSAAVNRLVPREWTGSAGIIGSWKKEPRLDPNQYEWTVNPENGRYFARPRTELTGLDPQARADVAAFDTQGQQQSARIQSAFDQFVKEAEANRAATTAGLTGLAGAVGAGYMTSDPTAAALQGTSRATAQAQALPVAARLSDAPLVARSEGVSRLQDFLGQRREQRGELISGYRQTAAEAEAARAETAAELRGQNLEHLGKVLTGKVDIQEANIKATTAAQDREAKLRTEAAKIRARADIARQNNQTSRANTLDRLATQREIAANKEKKKKAATGERKKRIRDNARALGLAQQLKRGTLNDDGTRTIYTFEEIVSNLTGNFDLTPKEAEKIARRAGAAPAIESVGGIVRGW